MNEETAAAFQREGEITFPDAESTADDTAAESRSEEENKEGDTQSSEGGNNSQDENKEVPFHEHPRWKQREDEWNTRFNNQETRHQDDLKAIREEFAGARKENAQNTKIPSWFGGTQEQWDAYRADRDAELKTIEDRAIERAKTDFKSTSEAGEKAVQEATDYFKSEVTAIEGDKTLNPTGVKIDKALAEKLLQTVVSEDLIDTKGRWNYRAAWKLVQGTSKPAPTQKPKTDEKKEIAAASTTGESGGEKKAPNYATSDTFRKDRPW